MSDAAPKKIYANGIYVREHEFQNGGRVLNVSVRVEQFVSWLREQPQDADGFVRLQVAGKRNPDKYGTHSVSLDTWNKVRNDGARREGTPSPTEAKPEPDESPLKEGEGGKPDDLPW